MRVLLIDDHEVVRRGLRFLLLSQSKYEVCGEAIDGEDALEKAQQLKPDVIVMDLSMPKRNGIEATRLIRSMHPDSEVLIPQLTRIAGDGSAGIQGRCSGIRGEIINPQGVTDRLGHCQSAQAFS